MSREVSMRQKQMYTNIDIVPFPRTGVAEGKREEKFYF